MKRPLLLCLSTLALAACSFTGSLAKESVLSLTERGGREHFTLAGELPAHFQLQTTAKYDVLDASKCQTYSIGLGENVTRDMIRQETTDLKNVPHNFSLKIPLMHHVGTCAAELRHIKLDFEGRYGDQSWQRHGDFGSISIADTTPQTMPAFRGDGTLKIRGMCTWMFQVSRLRYDISKLLSCSQPDENWHLDPDMSKRKGIGTVLGRDELAGKTVFLELRVDPQERPSHRNTWIQFPEGWKPCEPKEGGWISCQDPPIFKTFEMNGQQCTVYPNCTE